MSIMFQAISSQCIGHALYRNGFLGPFGGRGYDGLSLFGRRGLGQGCGCGYGGVPSSFGGGFTVTSSSPVAPTGLVVTSENAIEGAVTVIGSLPFLGAVSTDGSFPTSGTGAISSCCGDGTVGIVSESFISPIIGDFIVPSVTPVGFTSFPRGLWGGFRKGGCGCRGVY